MTDAIKLYATVVSPENDPGVTVGVLNCVGKEPMKSVCIEGVTTTGGGATA